MTNIEAIELLRKYTDHQESMWRRSPEGLAWMCKFDEAIDVLESTCKKPKTDLADAVSKAMRQSYLLGQTYWQQADSDSWKQHKKAGETSDKFYALVEETYKRVLTGV